MKPLNSKKCLYCGTEINGTHNKPPFMNVAIPHGFYGGRVHKMMKSVCDCGEEYISMLRGTGNSYELIDLAYFRGKPLKVKKKTVVKPPAKAPIIPPEKEEKKEEEKEIVPAENSGAPVGESDPLGETKLMDKPTVIEEKTIEEKTKEKVETVEIEQEEVKPDEVVEQEVREEVEEPTEVIESNTVTREYLDSLEWKDLQAFAKINGIKAVGKKTELIDKIMEGVDQDA